MEDGVAATILKELKEFREENNQKWNVNEKRWKENERRWEENQKSWDENQNNLREMNIRIAKLELNREKDRKELFDVLDSMQKSITQQMCEMREYFDIKFAKMDAAHRAYEVQSNQMLQMIYTHEKRFGFYDSRIQRLENWKDELDMGEFTAV